MIDTDVVLTRKTGAATILLTIARLGETYHELSLRYIPITGKIKEGEHNPEEVCQLVLRYLANSFGWYEVENERKIIRQDFEATNPDGTKAKYQAHVWVIPIRKHGALIRR